jgi:hypothetical protein
MSTNINITVGDSGLLDRARQQQAASRQTQLNREASVQLEAEATAALLTNANAIASGAAFNAARTAAFAAQGRDATGNLITAPSRIQPYIAPRPAANRRRKGTYRVEARLDIEAITSDQMVFQLAVRYGYGNSTTGIFNWTEQFRTVTINGVAEGFREPDMPPADGRAFGGNTRADTLLLCGVENSAAPFSSLVPSVVLVVKAGSFWGVWIPNPGFDFPWTSENYEIDLSQKIVVGTENPAFSEQIAEFEAAPYVTQFTTLFDSDAELVADVNYTVES